MNAEADGWMGREILGLHWLRLPALATRGSRENYWGKARGGEEEGTCGCSHGLLGSVPMPRTRQVISNSVLNSEHLRSWVIATLFPATSNRNKQVK